MPKKAKEEIVEKETKNIKKKNTSERTNEKVRSKKDSSKKQGISNNSNSKKKTSITKKEVSSVGSKTSSRSKVSTGSQTASSKATSTTKKTSSEKQKKNFNKVTTKKVTHSKKVVPSLEYYDLPSVYQQTVVKVLAQTPFCLFVYWEVSETDRKDFEKQYGNTFFQDTKPYLIVTNETKNYTFEIEISDYANSWYIHIADSDNKYRVALVRKPINHTVSTTQSQVYISSSNEMNSPNDHILFDKLGKIIFFRNTKTNITEAKDVTSISFLSNLGKIYNIYDLCKEIYQNELNGDELGTNLSSSQFSSTFK